MAQLGPGRSHIRGQVLARAESVLQIGQTMFERGVAESGVPAPKSSSVFWTEFVHPRSNGFVADENITLDQQIFDISNAEIEAVIV